MRQLNLFEERRELRLETIRQLFAETQSELKMGRVHGVIQVEFYPFVGINHTIRLTGGGLHVRLSDLFREASTEVIKALAIILLSKLFRRRIPHAANAIYTAYVSSSEMKQRSLVTRSQRGRKLLRDPRGTHHDLALLFDRLNGEYFQNRLKPVRLGWSPNRSRRVLGHFDPSHGSITISRILDDKKVPDNVVSYVLYHEMLHARFSTSSHFDLKNRHGRQFKNEEKKFKWHQESNQWLRKNL